MAHDIDFKIIGDNMQAVEIELDPSESVRAEVGAMFCMEDDIQDESRGIGGLLGRIISGRE